MARPPPSMRLLIDFEAPLLSLIERTHGNTIRVLLTNTFCFGFAFLYSFVQGEGEREEGISASRKEGRQQGARGLTKHMLVLEL